MIKLIYLPGPFKEVEIMGYLFLTKSENRTDCISSKILPIWREMLYFLLIWSEIMGKSIIFKPLLEF